MEGSKATRHADSGYSTIGGGDVGGTVYTHRPSGFVMGAGLPLIFVCVFCFVLLLLVGAHGPGTGVAISCSQCLEVTGHRPAPKERSESKHVALMHAFKLFAR